MGEAVPISSSAILTPSTLSSPNWANGPLRLEITPILIGSSPAACDSPSALALHINNPAKRVFLIIPIFFLRLTHATAHHHESKMDHISCYFKQKIRDIFYRSPDM